MVATSVFYVYDRRGVVRSALQAIALTAGLAAVFVVVATLAPIVLAALAVLLAQATTIAVGCCVVAFPALKILGAIALVPVAMKLAFWVSGVAVKLEMKGRK